MDYSKQIILYGLSMFKDNVLEMLSDKYGSFENAKKHILFFTDSNKAYWGSSYKGISVRPPFEIIAHPDAVICILSYKFDDIGDNLRKMGVKNDVYMSPFLVYRTYYDLEYGRNYINKHEAEIYSLYNQNDEYTMNLLNHIISERKEGKEEFQKIESFKGLSEVNEYFYDVRLNGKGDMTWIDVGAYTGDTIELAYLRFSDSIKKYYVFEPSRENLVELKRTIERLNIGNKTEILEFGLGNKEQVLSFNEKGALSSIVSRENNMRILIKTLDSLNLDIVGNPYIKMDIEGAEMSALRGMKEFITKYRPYMAICLYHRVEDILEVPSYIHEIDKNYKFYLRAGMHTECYAIPM